MEYWILLVTIVLAFIIAPFLGVLPAGREKKVMKLRALAQKAGLEVQFLREKDKDGRTRFKYVPGSRLPLVEYRLSLPHPTLQQWCYRLSSGAENSNHYDWLLEPGGPPLSSAVMQSLQQFTDHWPPNLTNISVHLQERSAWVTWDEQGNEAQVQQIISLLKELAQLQHIVLATT